MQSIQLELSDEMKSAISEMRNDIADLKNNFQPKTPAEYLTRQETADLLKVDLSTIHNYTKQGKLNAWGIGNRVYYKRVEVENAIVKLKK